jgi:hypothetical protein
MALALANRREYHDRRTNPNGRTLIGFEQCKSLANGHIHRSLGQRPYHYTHFSKIGGRLILVMVAIGAVFRFSGSMLEFPVLAFAFFPIRVLQVAVRSGKAAIVR